MAHQASSKQITPFSFVRRFDRPDEPESTAKTTQEAVAPEPPPEPTFTKAEIDRARSEAAEKARQQAAQEAARSREAQLADTLDQISRSLSATDGEIASIRNDAAAAVLNLSRIAVRKILPEAAHRYALEAIAELADKRLPALVSEPSIEVQVSPDLAEPVREHLARSASLAGFAGRIDVKPVPSLKAGDCRIHWNHGGLEMSLDQAIDQAAAHLDRLSESTLPISHAAE